MSLNIGDFPDLGSFIAYSLQGKNIEPLKLAGALVDIVIETSTQAASTLAVTLVDENWELLTSGWLDTDESGYLQPVAVEFPEGSDMNWELCTVDASTDLGQANVTLTFEDRIVASLRKFFGAKKATRGPSMTRAEFIRSLTKEVTIIKFQCPELRVVQPIQVDPALLASTSKKVGQAFANPTKKKGIHPKHGVTVKGAKANATQIKAIEESLAEADRQNAPSEAVVAMMCAGTAESTFTPSSVAPNGIYKGVYQSNQVPQYDTTQQAHYFLAGGKGFNHGGAIYLATHGTKDPGQIATLVEGSGANPDFYGKWADEARRTIAAYGGAGSLQAASSTPTTVTTSSYAFTRGTTDDPDEDSWSCMNRLAQEVNWSLFTSGPNLYYMDGPDLIGQKPSLVIDRVADGAVVASLSFTWDNTSFDKSTRKLAGKIKRPANLQRADSPTEGKLDLICGLDDYRAGEVIILESCGPANGRWIITDATRSVFNVFTEFTLSPPTSPIPEPAPDTTTKTVSASDLAHESATVGGAFDGSSGSGSAPAGGKVGYPLAKRGKLIGVPYEGTHGKAFNVAGGSDNWQSENAVDLGTPVGTPILAVDDGTISPDGLGFGPSASGGRFAGIRMHLKTESNTFFYTHLSAIQSGISPGRKVKKGDVIGRSGSANGVAHLHFADLTGDPRNLIGQHS